MTAVVTGATGFLGGALARELLRRGTAVRALARRPEAAEPLRDLGADVHVGDLEQPDTLAGLVRAGDTVYHCAARVDLSGPLTEFERINVAGTRNLLACCADQRPQRFVQVSSGAVYGAEALGRAVSADEVTASPARYNYYGRTKLAAEKLVATFCGEREVPWVVLRLGFLYGVGNRALMDHVEPLLRRKRYVLIGEGDNRIATLEISDAVAATIAVGTHPAAVGRTYDAASAERVTQREFFAATADVIGAPKKFRTIHPRLVHPLAGVTEWICGLLGRPAPFNRAMVDLLGADQAVDSGALERELDWRPQVTFAEGMERLRHAYAARSDEAKE